MVIDLTARQNVCANRLRKCSEVLSYVIHLYTLLVFQINNKTMVRLPNRAVVNGGELADLSG